MDSRRCHQYKYPRKAKLDSLNNQQEILIFKTSGLETNSHFEQKKNILSGSKSYDEA